MAEAGGPVTIHTILQILRRRDLEGRRHFHSRMIEDTRAAAMEWLRRLPLLVGFIGLYVALDAASFIHPLHGLNITPWNPAPALGLVLVVRLGRIAWLPLTIAVVVAELAMRRGGLPTWQALVPALVLAGGYFLLGRVLARRLAAASLLNVRRTLFAWWWRVAVGTLLISVVYLFALRVVGLLPPARWWIGLLRFWVGDGVGISIMMPLLWWLSSPRARGLLRSTVARPESLGYLLLASLTLWIAFGFGGHNGFKLFYLLFLPVVWAAARQGMAGAIVCAAFVQIGVIVAMRFLHYNAVSVAELQILAMAIAMVGFFVAAAVDEQRRTGQDLRQSLRLAAAGEMAAALTHELHHPLTALSAYAGACEQLLERGEVGERLHSAIRCVVRESARTSEVVHRLQGFFRSGSPELESVSLGELVDSAAAPYRLRAERSGIRLRIATMPDLTLRVDRLQVEVVLRSLLGFAFDAVSDSPRQPRRIWVAAWKDGHDRVCLRIEDSGSGLTPDQVLHLFEPIAPSGSGKRQSGLAISRAIVHSHGGRLWAETSNHGVLKCELPIERHAAAAPVPRNDIAPAVS